MIYLYGDSHAHFSFKELARDHKDDHCPSITMFRIGRDNIIINLTDNIKENDVVVLSYGEVDCRCHIQRQIDHGRDEDTVINELVHAYYQTILSNITVPCHVIIVGVIPPTRREDYEAIHGPILHEFPFIGTDEDRVRYTNKMNGALEEWARTHKHHYFNPYAYYTREDGTLHFELSDEVVHIGDNSHVLEQFYELLENIK